MNIENSSFSAVGDDEVASLIATLIETGHRLEVLTSGEIDAVLGPNGRAFLLRRAQEQLRLSEEAKQAAIINALPAHIALIDGEGVIVSFNRAWQEFAEANGLVASGYGIGINYLDTCDGSRGGDKAAEGIRSVLAGNSSRFSLEYPCNSPTQQRWFLMTVTPLSDTGRGGAVIMHLNISAEHRARESLLASELQFRQMAESVGDAFTLREFPSRRMLYVNPAYESIWGRSCASLYAEPDSWLDAIHPDDAHLLLSPEGGEAYLPNFHLDFRITRPDGEIRWIELRRFPVHDDEGTIVRVAGIAKDITERMQALGATEASEKEQRNLVQQLDTERARLVDAQRVAQIGSWETDVAKSTVVWSDGTHLIYETDPSIFHPTHQGFMALVHPADREAVDAAFDQSLDHKNANVMEHRLLLADGRIKYVEERWQILFDTESKAIRAVGTTQDVTHRKQAELKILGLNRVYAVLSQINSLIVRVANRDELYTEACGISVEKGRFRMAMIAMLDQATGKIVPIASAGKDEALLQTIRNVLASDESASTTMVATAMRDKTAIVSNNTELDPRALLREDYTKAGVRSLAVLPLIVAHEAVGVLALYSAEKNFFHEEEMKLLTGLADNIAFAIDHIDKQERLDHLASYDPVTGLANRHLFLERLAQRMLSAADQGHRKALVLIDLERFKNINDSLGRPSGDVLLQQVGEWLTQYLGEVSRVARIGEDHFAVMFPEAADSSDVARQLDAMVDAFLGHPFRLKGDVYRIAAKFGVAIFPDDGPDADLLFKNAEAALKKAKAGGHRHLFYAQKMTETVVQRLNLENQLRQALDNQEFVLHYQPKLSLATRRVTSVEALIRWNDPRTGLVAPGLFIPILEETGLIYEVGRWALQQSLQDYLRWRAEGLRAVRIAVNVSPMQFRHPGFIAALEQLVASDAYAAEGLELELTEGIIMGDMQQAIACLHAIRALGISIAIDDFGTGFSSLGYLSKLPIDTLKIDRMFVTDMVVDARGLSLVSTIISLAHSLQLKVVAEGVETEEQSNLLRLLKCDELQGYLFSKPIPVVELERKYLAPPPGEALASVGGGRVDAKYIARLLQLRAIVAEQGVRAGLVYLNGLTEHRFTALYRFDGDTLHNAVFYDRENPSATSTESIPVLASYCVFVRDSNTPFHTNCAADDDRLGDHPKRKLLQSYCGVPLRDSDGTPFGTICHFDFARARISQENLELMEDIAPAVQEKI